MGSLGSLFLLLLLLLGMVEVFNGMQLVGAGDPTDGFTEIPLTDWNLEVQKPYDKPLNERYSYKDGVHTMWVYSNDKPHDPTSNTKPRTEIRIRGHDYTSGVWQFEAYAFVPNGTSGVNILQIFGATAGASTFMLRVYNGDLKYYSAKLVERHVYNNWMRFNLIHNADEGKVTLFIDGVKKIETKGRGPGDHYFKCGVYTQVGASYYMESRWKNIKIFKK